MTISNDSRTRVKKAFEPIALGMGRLGLTPDALTLIGFAITVVGAVLVAQQLWLLGGVVVLLGGIFDMFDGTLARATGRVSNLGAFMDSVFDRAGEVIVYIGIAWGCVAVGFGEGAVLATAALASAVMVSYSRAKSDGLGFTSGSGMASVGIAPREIRLAILSVGLMLVGAIGHVGPTNWECPTDQLVSCVQPDYFVVGDALMSGTLALITLLATITVIQRILHVRGQAKQQSTQTQTH